MKKFTIWSNRDIDYNEWKEIYKETAEANEWDEDTENEDNLQIFISEELERNLDDERANLNIPLDGDILVIADLGLWNGRRQGYKILHGNVSNIFTTGEDYTEWYSDGYNIKAIAGHHDGDNRYLYREIKNNKNIGRLLSDIYEGKKITRQRLNYYTKSLHPCVAKIYGWK